MVMCHRSRAQPDIELNMLQPHRAALPPVTEKRMRSASAPGAVRSLRKSGALARAGSDPDVRSRPDRDAAGEARARRDVRVISDRAVVLEHRGVGRPGGVPDLGRG